MKNFKKTKELIREFTKLMKVSVKGLNNAKSKTVHNHGGGWENTSYTYETLGVESKEIIIFSKHNEKRNIAIAIHNDKIKISSQIDKAPKMSNRQREEIYLYGDKDILNNFREAQRHIELCEFGKYDDFHESFRLLVREARALEVTSIGDVIDCFKMVKDRLR